MSGGTLATWIRTGRRQAARRRAAEGVAGDLAAAVAPLAVSAAVTPLIQPVFLGFLHQPDLLSEGTAGVLVRLLLLVGGATALEAHQVVLRTGDRAVLSGLPVDPAPVVAWELLRLAASRWWIVPCAAIALVPLAVVSPPHWAASLAVLAAVQLAALPAGAAGALLAIQVADDPRWEAVLDAVRGQNPRLQASLLWMPGVVLGFVGGAGALAAFGAIDAVDGDPVRALAVFAPLAIGAVLAALLPALSRRAWFRGTPLLLEIDARYAALERPEDAGRVYLDWAVRFLPRALRTWALADLRHGWRGRRSWITAAWGVGVVAGLAGWSADPASVARAAALACVGAWVCGTVSGWMERDIPPFTRILLDDRGAARMASRAAVVAAWLQPAALVPLVPVGVRQGLGTALGLFGFVELSIGAASLVAAGLARARLGLVGYAPLAALAAGLAVAAAGAVWGGRA